MKWKGWKKWKLLIQIYKWLDESQFIAFGSMKLWTNVFWSGSWLDVSKLDVSGCAEDSDRAEEAGPVVPGELSTGDTEAQLDIPLLELSDAMPVEQKVPDPAQKVDRCRPLTSGWLETVGDSCIEWFKCGLWTATVAAAAAACDCCCK